MRLSVSLGVLALGAGVAAGPIGAADRGEILPRARARLAGVADTETLRRAVSGAAARLHGPSCQKLLTEFEDEEGRPLADRLSSLGKSADRYLDEVVFVDGASVAKCHRREVLAVTTPGARVVHVCAAQFVTAALQDPTLAQAIVIHEMLHTLGLGENPPTSRDITSRVLQACRG
jgi:hypothetical protein